MQKEGFNFPKPFTPFEVIPESLKQVNLKGNGLF